MARQHRTIGMAFKVVDALRAGKVTRFQVADKLGIHHTTAYHYIKAVMEIAPVKEIKMPGHDGGNGLSVYWLDKNWKY